MSTYQSLNANAATIGTLTLTNKLPVTSVANGTDGQTLMVSGTTNTWTSVSNYYMYAGIPFTSGQDWNGASTVNLTFGNIAELDYTVGTPLFVPISTTGSAPYSNFTVNYTNNSYYRFDFACQLDNAAIGSAQIAIRLVVNGTPTGGLLYSTVLPTLVTGKNTIYGTIIRQIAAGTTIGFQASRVQGTGALTPSVSSTCVVYVTLVDNVR